MYAYIIPTEPLKCIVTSNVHTIVVPVLRI